LNLESWAACATNENTQLDLHKRAYGDGCSGERTRVDDDLVSSVEKSSTDSSDDSDEGVVTQRLFNVNDSAAAAGEASEMLR
jgi:hypothetical protein